MQYLSQNSNLTWGNKKIIRGMSIQERDDASIAFVTVFVGSRCFLISIWSGNLGWVSDKARRVLTTYCAGLFIIGLSQILWSCVCKSASFRNPYGLKYFLPQAGSTKAQTYIIYIYIPVTSWQKVQYLINQWSTRIPSSVHMNSPKKHFSGDETMNSGP